MNENTFIIKKNQMEKNKIKQKLHKHTPSSSSV